MAGQPRERRVSREPQHAQDSQQFINDKNPEYFYLPDTEDTVENYLDAFRLVNSREFLISGFVSDDLSAMTVFINATQISNQEVLDLDTQITQKFSEIFSDAELILAAGCFCSREWTSW